jgi:hypothetical protein
VYVVAVVLCLCKIGVALGVWAGTDIGGIDKHVFRVYVNVLHGRVDFLLGKWMLRIGYAWLRIGYACERCIVVP